MKATRVALGSRSLLALLAVCALVVAAAPPTWADHAEGAEHSVECDAEFFEFEDDEAEEEGFPEVDGFYVVEPGQEVTCTAEGLDPEVDAHWRVLFYDLEALFEDEESDPDDGFGEPVDDDGRTVDAEEHDGTIVFSFVPPEGLRFGLFEGLVWQGVEDPDAAEEGQLTYEEHFLGLIFPEIIEGDMTCEPDPVRQGEDVECVAEEMTPDEDFEWEVHFFTLEELFEDIFGEEPDEGDLEEFFQPDVEGDGTADGDGFGIYSFTVPTDREIDGYFTFVYQDAEDEYFAFYIGEVVPAEAEEEEEHGEPVSVQPPTRVDTGVGGAAGNSVPMVLILGSLLAAAAVTLRRTIVGGR